MKTRLVLLLAAITISAAVTAQHRGPKGVHENEGEECHMPERHCKERCDNFNNFFTDEQKETIKALRLETAKAVKPLKNKLQELKAHQHSLATAEKADIKVIYKNIDKMAELKAEIAKIQAKQLQDIRGLLTEEQLIQFDLMRGRKGKRHFGGFKNHHLGRG